VLGFRYFTGQYDAGGKFPQLRVVVLTDRTQ
jgi:hypothetical protein